MVSVMQYVPGMYDMLIYITDAFPLLDYVVTSNVQEIAGRRVTLNELLPDVAPHKNEAGERVAHPRGGRG